MTLKLLQLQKLCSRRLYLVERTTLLFYSKVHSKSQVSMKLCGFRLGLLLATRAA